MEEQKQPPAPTYLKATKEILFHLNASLKQIFNMTKMPPDNTVADYSKVQYSAEDMTKCLEALAKLYEYPETEFSKVPPKFPVELHEKVIVPGYSPASEKVNMPPEATGALEGMMIKVRFVWDRSFEPLLVKMAGGRNQQ